MHRPESNNQPTPERLAELLDRAEQHIAAQRDAYGTELDEDHAWRCAWNTWRTLTDLTTAVRALLAQQQDAANVIPLRTEQAVPEPMPLGRTA